LHEFCKQVAGLESAQVRNQEAVKRFFSRFQSRLLAYPKNPCCIPNATTIGCHGTNLLLDLWQQAGIAIFPNQGAAFALLILAGITLFAFRRFAMLNDLSAITIWAMNGVLRP